MKLTLKLDYIIDVYWCPLKSYSYNMTFNFIMSSRDDGKTTNSLIGAIKNFNNTGGSFVLVRRYDNETALCKDILDEIIEEKVIFKGDKNGGGKFYVNKFLIGYLVPVSKQKKYKGKKFKNVNYLIYDEYTLDRDYYLLRYLPKDVIQFLELINTIFRLGQKYKVFILGNNLDYMNPFFEYFNIPDIEIGKCKYFKEKDLFIDIYESKPKMKELKEQTPLAKLTNNTSYSDFNMNNNLINGKKYKVREKRDNDKLFLRLLYNEYTISIYNSYSISYYITLKKEIIEDNDTILILNDDVVHYDNIKLLKGIKQIKTIKNNAITNKFIEYDNKKTAMLFNSILYKYLK